MSKFETLLRQLCPNGVEYKLLGQIAGYSETRIDAKNLDSTNFVGVDNLLSNAGGKINASYTPNTSRLTGYQVGDILLGNIRPYLKKVWLADNNGGCSGDVLAVRILPEFNESLIPRFLYYQLSSDKFFAYSMQHAKGAKMPRGSKEAVLKYPTPIPPPEVQNEVVRILDNFTEMKGKLEVELEVELEARRKQYHYYRDSLLSFNNRAITRWMTLSEIATITIGEFVHKNKQNPNGVYPVYNGGKTPTGYYDEYNNDGDKIIISARGANAGFVNRISTPYWAGNSCYSIGVTDTNLVDWSFAYYFLKNSQSKLIGDQQKGGIPAVSKKQIEDFKVPVPSISEQTRIVNSLNKFDSLVNDISEGLPAEIKARRKQYEYYRNQLLSFQETA